MIERRDMVAFARMLNKALDVRKMPIDTLSEESGVSPLKLRQWSDSRWQAGAEPTSRELEGLGKTLGIPASDIERWLSLEAASFGEQAWLLASVMIPGLNQENWGEMEATDEQSEEEGIDANSYGLVEALIPLVIKFGPRVVARVADDLYRETKEGKEEQADLATAASEERWDRQRQASGSRTASGGRKSLTLEAARRALGG